MFIISLDFSALQRRGTDEKKGFQEKAHHKKQARILGKRRRIRNRTFGRVHSPSFNVLACRSSNHQQSFGAVIMEKMTLKKAVLLAFDSLPVGAEFYANQLRSKAAELFPQAANKYENSILMVLRRHRREFYHYADRSGKLVKVGE